MMSKASLHLHAPPFDITSIPGLPELWKAVNGYSDIRIAVIDGPIDYSHPCFKQAALKPAESTGLHNFSHSDIAFQHGTAVASILFGGHEGPVKGVAPHCKGTGITVFREEDGKLAPCSQLDLARAILLAAEQGAQVINISGGEFSSSGKSDRLLANAIEACYKQGILIVSAAGNDGCACLHVPASEPMVLAVGAMSEANVPLPFSNWGSDYRKNGLLFPGNNIVAAIPGNSTTLKTGTSFATPIASGIAALLMCLQVKNLQPADGRLVYKALLNTAIRCNPDTTSGCEKTLAGRLHIPGAMEQILNTSINRNKKGVNKMLLTEQTVLPSDIELSGSIESVETLEHLSSAAVTDPEGVNPSDCGCQKKSGEAAPASGNGGSGCGCGGKKPPAIVYAIGHIGHEFKSEANRDAFSQMMNGNASDPLALLNFLNETPEAAEDVVWTLNLDATPVYVLYPFGTFATTTFDRIKDAYRAQLAGQVNRVSIPGTIGGKTKCMSGQELPVIVPRPQGIFSWSTEALLAATLGAAPDTNDDAELQAYNSRAEGVINFLDRVYYELRNLGITSQERAINYAATNAFQVGQVFQRTASENLELDTIDVERSPVCRPGSDCWDVKLVFFNPTRRTEQARKVYRFTIDVSHVIPVTVGTIRSWNIF
jgi:cyanobactin maturation PatA/PatG family protease